MKRIGRVLPFLLFVLVTSITAPSAFSADAPAAYQRTEDVIYGRKFGVALTMDVFTPAHANGKGIIFIVSGGWFSSREMINTIFFGQLLDDGYTVFTVMHGSQPKFHVDEIEPDLFRSVRFIRHNAAKFHIDPHEIGCLGGSAGGHLSLTLATQGGPGDPKAKDPVDRESSEVQAAAAFFPPTDFLNYGKPGVDAVGVGPLAAYYSAFGPRADSPESRQVLGKQISPIYYVHAGMPPVLLIHGDADTLVPVQQSQIFIKACELAKVPAQLIVRHGKGHGWFDLGQDLAAISKWFDEKLGTKSTKSSELQNAQP